MNPTMSPTMDPTMNPTMDPTMNPTMDPTMDPTMHPTLQPTTAPTRCELDRTWWFNGEKCTNHAQEDSEDAREFDALQRCCRVFFPDNAGCQYEDICNPNAGTPVPTPPPTPRPTRFPTRFPTGKPTPPPTKKVRCSMFLSPRALGFASRLRTY